MASPPAHASTLRALSRALRHRNYRLFFAGQSVSLVGTWLTRVATSWLVYRLTNSALVLGLVGFAGQIPTFLLAPLAGVWVDRINRHRALVATQVLAMVQSALLAAFTLTHSISVGIVIALQVFQGVINAVDMPARQAFVVEMIEDRRDLPNAIALNSSMVNAARLLGPSLAGVLIATVGEGLCFALDAASYIAVVLSLVMMKVAPRGRPDRRSNMLTDLTEGYRYVAQSVPIRSVLLLLALVSLTGMPYTVLMPAVAREVLRGGAGTLGVLMAASGFGALAGALYLASRETVLGLGRIIGFCAAAFGVGLVALSLSREFWLSLLLMAPTGMAAMVQMAASNTVLQTVVDEDKRGRVMSFYAMAFFGMTPIGSLLAGVVADRYGAATAIGAGGVACIAGAAAFMRALPAVRQAARPIYVKLGILPENVGSIPPPLTVPPDG
jgi:MFS family permease